VRFAPGMIQIVRFDLANGKPCIRSYPMTAYTTALLVNPGIQANSWVTLTLSRGDVHDDLPLWQMAKPRQVVTQVLQALMSTAPTPPLSDEELVG